ncbi:DUF5908 family protein [Ideonella sp. DXS22W]|uniref:DUF5908 family protein n=1 Tax=Pseudaquabacterium inlustre TaxID=2984192 RepID=A0ABU9CDF5_9BURK
MPIEIKELVIRTQVSPGGGEEAVPLADGLPAEHGAPPGDSVASGLDTEQLVQECVRQVLRILARQRER